MVGTSEEFFSRVVICRKSSPMPKQSDLKASKDRTDCYASEHGSLKPRPSHCCHHAYDLVGFVDVRCCNARDLGGENCASQDSIPTLCAD